MTKFLILAIFVTISRGSDVYRQILDDCSFLSDTTTPPAFYETPGGVPLEIRLVLRQLLNVDDLDESLTLTGGIHILFTISCAAETAKKYNSNLPINSSLAKYLLITKPDDYWKPPLFHFNSREDYGLSSQVYPIISFWPLDGILRYSFAGRLTPTCNLDFEKFPFDTQICHIYIDSWLPAAQVKVVAVSSLIAKQDTFITDNVGWTFLNASQEPPKIMPFAPDGEYYRFTFSIAIRRRPLFHVITTIAPCLFLTIVHLAAFFIPAEYPDRAGFAVTMLLSFMVVQSNVQANLPKTPANILLNDIICGEIISATFVTVYSAIMCLIASPPNDNQKTLQIRIFGKKRNVTVIQIIDLTTFLVLVTILVLLNTIVASIIIAS